MVRARSFCEKCSAKPSAYIRLSSLNGTRAWRELCKVALTRPGPLLPRNRTHVISDEPAVSEHGMPGGADIRGVFQGGLFMLALLAALYAGREIVLPIVLAIILNLLLQPALRMLDAFTCREYSVPFS